MRQGKPHNKTFFEEFHNAIDDLYYGSHRTLDDDGDDGYMPTFDDSLFEKVAREILNQGSYTPNILSSDAGRNLIDETHQILWDGVSRGLSEQVDETVRATLEQNTFIFSGFKTNAELQEVSTHLTDDNGNIKPWNEFRKEILDINKKYNENYLRAEYNHAVASAQMASKWQEFEKNKDIIDLQYRTAGDSKVRPEHRNLNGVTLPVDDEFWKKFTPPLDWNCRCTVVAVSKNREKEVPTFPSSDNPKISDSSRAIDLGNAATAKPKQKIFRFNPGIDLKIFPPKHPYFPKGCGNCKDKTGGIFKLAYYDPKNPKCQKCGIINRCLKNRLTTKTLKEYANGGHVKVYDAILNRDSLDYKRIFSVADKFAQMGRKVTLLPKIDSPINCDNYDVIYKDLIGTKYYGKCPDLLIDGIYYEHEGFITKKPKKALKNMLKHGSIQSDKLILENPDLQNWYIIQQIKNKASICEVWLHDGENLTLIYKKSD